MEIFFTSTFAELLRILVSAPIIYFLVILYIRMAGKRSTSQMNSFDWIVTVAMGSLVASAIILKETSLLESAFSIFLLLSLQYLVTKTIVHSAFFRDLFKPKPCLLLYNGEFLHENMKKERMVEEEIYAAIRMQGFPSKQQVYAVVLETDAKLSVIGKDNNLNTAQILSNVGGLPEALKRELE